MAHYGEGTPQPGTRDNVAAGMPASEAWKAFDQLDVGVLQVDGDLKLTHANAYARGILAAAGEKLEGQLLRDILPAALSQQLSEAAARAVEEGKTVGVDAFCPAPEHRWLQCRCVPGWQGATIFLQDVTGLKKMQESLEKAHSELEQEVQERTRNLRLASRRIEEQKELLLTIIDNIPAMLIFFDPSGSVRLVNRSFEMLAGWSLEEARSMNLIAACYPEPALRKEVWEYMMMARPGWKDFELTTRSGRVLPSSWAYVRLSDGSQIGIGIDMSDRRRMEGQMLQVQKMQALGNLAGGIAKNLKNAFTPILIDTEMLMADLGKEHPSYPILEEMMHAILHGIELVKHLLIFSASQTRHKKTLDLVPVFREALDFLRASLPSTIVIRSRIEADSAVVLADHTQIKQVLVNIGSSAGYIMREHGGILEAELAMAALDAASAAGISPDLAPGPYVRITMGSTGQGVGGEDVEHIFEPFRGAKGEGAGLGLFVAHGIVKNHTGAVTAQSGGDRGIVFTVYLPLKIGDQGP